MLQLCCHFDTTGKGDIYRVEGAVVWEIQVLQDISKRLISFAAMSTWQNVRKFYH